MYRRPEGYGERKERRNLMDGKRRTRSEQERKFRLKLGQDIENTRETLPLVVLFCFFPRRQLILFSYCPPDTPRLLPPPLSLSPTFLHLPFTYLISSTPLTYTTSLSLLSLPKLTIPSHLYSPHVPPCIQLNVPSFYSPLLAFSTSPLTSTRIQFHRLYNWCPSGAALTFLWGTR